MSSHREAPEIAKDPVADSTDLYVFVSPDVPNTVTVLANYVPLEGPAGGTYSRGDGREELTIDAVEWIWILSGRGTGTGLLEKELPL